jgi:transcriptional regulator with XRE-family HTH domain
MGVYGVNSIFAENLKKIREERGLSQKQLGEYMFVTQSTVARWENGSRLPDAAMISRLSQYLGVGVDTLLNASAKSDEAPKVIMVDDTKVILTEGLAVLEEVLPDAEIKGFIWPQEAIDYARANRVALAVLDIELGNSSGLALCRTLLEINPRTNVLFLTAYPDYSLDAWGTEACGFMLKPITAEGMREQLKKLRYPFLTGGMDA